MNIRVASEATWTGGARHRSGPTTERIRSAQIPVPAIAAMKKPCIEHFEAFGTAGHAVQLGPLSLDAMAKRYASGTSTRLWHKRPIYPASGLSSTAAIAFRTSRLARMAHFAMLTHRTSGEGPEGSRPVPWGSCSEPRRGRTRRRGQPPETAGPCLSAVATPVETSCSELRWVYLRFDSPDMDHLACGLPHGSERCGGPNQHQARSPRRLGAQREEGLRPARPLPWPLTRHARPFPPKRAARMNEKDIQPPVSPAVWKQSCARPWHLIQQCVGPARVRHFAPWPEPATMRSGPPRARETS